MNESILLSALIFSPIIGMLVLLFVPKTAEKSLKLVGFLATLLPLVLALIVYSGFNPLNKDLQFVESYKWISFDLQPAANLLDFSIRYELGVNGFSVLLILLTTIVTTLAAAASIYIKKEWKGYFLLFLFLEIGVLGVFSAQNLFLFFVFFEITLIPMFFLIGKWGYMKKEKAAYNYLLYNGLGSAILLIVFVILFMKTGTVNIEKLTAILQLPESDLAKIRMDEGFRTGMLIAILIAFGVKLPIAPLHSWMLRVHVEAPPAIVMIHSGVLLKIGAYGLIRFGLGFFPAEFKNLAVLIAILGVINLLYGAFIAFVQTDFKRILAYSSVSHMGIILIGLAGLNEAGVQGAIFQTISHGIISALLFFLVGVIYERTNSTMLDDLGGLAKSMPITAGLLLAGGLASLGLPGMSGFVSEFMAFLGLFEEMPIIAAVGTLGIILTAVYILRAILTITFGRNGVLESIQEPKFIEWLPALVLVGLSIVIGVYPMIISELLQSTLEIILVGIGG